jgi:hypothetical protein
MSKDKEPSSARNHLDAADSAYMRARQILEQADEKRHSIARIRISSSANLIAAIVPTPPANPEQTEPSIPPPAPFRRDSFTSIRRRRY